MRHAEELGPTIISRRIRSLSTVATAFIAVLGAGMLTACAGHTAPIVATYAYSTADELVVMRNDKVIARSPFKYTPKYRGAVWTLDSRYVAFITDDQAAPDDKSKRTLVAIDAANGSIRRLLCPYCTSLAPVGGSTMLISEEDPRSADSFAAMLRADLASAEPPVELQADLPPLTDVSFLAGIAEGVLAVGIDQYNAENYYLLNVSGSVKPIGTKGGYRKPGKQPLRGIRQAVAVQTGNDSPIFAVSAESKDPDSACAASGEVFLLSPQIEHLFTTDISPVAPVGFPPGQEALVTALSIWWGVDGRLHAAMVAGPCDGTSSLSTTTGEWVLDSNRWIQISQDKLYAVRDLGADAKLVASGEPDYQHGIKLYLEKDRHRTTLADDVVDIATPGTASDERTAADILRPFCPHDDSGQCVAQIDKRVDLGSRTGDLDGDGRSEKVNLSIEGVKQGTGKLTVRAALTGGARIDQVVGAEDQDLFVDWLGITDMNGDKKGDVAFARSVGAHTIVVEIYTEQAGRLVRIPGDLTELYLDGVQSAYVGFRCSVENSQAQVVTFRSYRDHSGSFDLSTFSYVGEETTYVADNAGLLKKTGSRSVNYSAEGDVPLEVVSRGGAHCEGLDMWPR